MRPATTPPRAGSTSARGPSKGMYQPDAVASFAIKGKTYYVLANEGDDRNDFLVPPKPQPSAPSRVSRSLRRSSATHAIAALRADADLGRLTVTTAQVPRNAANEMTELHVLGGRSFSVRDAEGALLL